MCVQQFAAVKLLVRADNATTTSDSEAKAISDNSGDQEESDDWDYELVLLPSGCACMKLSFAQTIAGNL